MGKVVKRVVLTGGPCAGKSTSLDLIKNYLSALGYLVYIVQESATEMINSGIKPFGEDSLTMVQFQEVLLKYQLEKERIIEDTIEEFNTDKEIVIIYDRNIIDFKAYIGKNEFDILLRKYSLNEFYLLNKFDIVIYLETAAKNLNYTNDNNSARSENVEEAIDLDNKLFDAWESHNNLFKIKCYDNFVDKQNEIIKVLEECFK